MNAKQAKLRDKMHRMTQWLDRKLPDARLSQEENDRAAEELDALCEQIEVILPRPSYSPEERLLRAATLLRLGPTSRTIDDTDAAKLARLKSLLEELVPGGDSAIEKARHLQSRMAEVHPEFMRQPAGF